MSYTYKYPRPAVTADVVAITKEEVPKVLLIQRGFEPYKGCWAFPGGFMEMNETTEECAIRELQEETELKLASMVQVGAYSKVDRDPRGRTITIAYLAIVDEQLSVIAQDDAAMAEWFSIKKLPTLAFDHNEIMTDAISMYKNTEQVKPMKMEDLKYTRSGLMLAVDSYFYDDFIYFWKHDEEKDKITKACLSQWYPSIFIVDGVTYNCAEQYMMAEKARIFGDEVIRVTRKSVWIRHRSLLA